MSISLLYQPITFRPYFKIIASSENSNKFEIFIAKELGYLVYKNIRNLL